MSLNLPKLHLSRFPKWLWITILVLVVIRLALPYIGLHTINWALANKMGTYDGRIQDFDLSLYRGAYQLQGLQIKKKDSDLPPILAVNEIDLSIAWRTLFSGSIAADVQIDRAVVRLMDSDKKEKKQLGNDEPGAKEAIKVIIPILVESVVIKNSAFYFTNNDLKIALPVQIESIYGKAEDLISLSNKPSESLSPFELEGFAMGHSQIKLNGKVDVLADPLRLDVNFSLVEFHPKSVNALLLSYLPLDLTSGAISIYGETAMAKGELKGYVNLFLKDVDVVAPDQKLLGVKHFFFEIISAAANWILKNKEKVLAAHIPFSRVGGKFDVKYGEAFSSVIENKKDPLKKGFDNSISLKNIEGK